MTEVRPVQFSKVDSFIEVTLFGMTMEVRPVHLAKAPLPIEVTLLGTVMEVRLLQPSNV